MELSAPAFMRINFRVEPRLFSFVELRFQLAHLALGAAEAIGKSFDHDAGATFKVQAARHAAALDRHGPGGRLAFNQKCWIWNFGSAWRLRGGTPNLLHVVVHWLLANNFRLSPDVTHVLRFHDLGEF